MAVGGQQGREIVPADRVFLQENLWDGAALAFSFLVGFFQGLFGQGLVFRQKGRERLSHIFRLDGGNLSFDEIEAKECFPLLYFEKPRVFCIS